jgi:hypothetical protein
MRPIDFNGFVPADPAEIVRQNPEASEHVAEGIKVVIGCLEEMLATAQGMLADLEKLGRPA